MATIPVYSPAVPFLGLIPGGLHPGSMIRIKGVINNHGERCQINIQTGAALNPRDDVTLHISIRPNEQAIVRNTMQKQVWGAEERYGGCPIYYGQTFDVLVLVEVNQYKIAINGTHYCTFSHRLPVYTAQYVSISGGCVIHSITSEMDSAGGSVPPYPSVPVYPINPPPYTPAPPGGSIGFVPAPPPPPPPYTPSPGYPVGGSGHYPGAPPYPGYPHHHGFPQNPPAVPSTASAPPSHPAASGMIYASPASGGQSKNMKQTITNGVQQTKNFLQDAIFGKTTATPSYPRQEQSYPSSQPPQYPHNAYPHQQAYGVPYPQTQPVHTASHHHQPAGGILSGSGLASAAIGAAATAAVLHKMPKKKGKKAKKLLKYGAGAGALGLGGYAIGKGLRRRGKSSSSSSSSSSD